MSRSRSAVEKQRCKKYDQAYNKAMQIVSHRVFPEEYERYRRKHGAKAAHRKVRDDHYDIFQHVLRRTQRELGVVLLRDPYKSRRHHEQQRYLSAG